MTRELVINSSLWIKVYTAWSDGCRKWTVICLLLLRPSPVCRKYCGQRVCLSVCLSARISQKHPNFTKFSVHVCGRISFLFWRQCNMLCTSGFVDDVMFAHDTANRPKNYIYVLAYVRRSRPISLQQNTAYVISVL